MQSLQRGVSQADAMQLLNLVQHMTGLTSGFGRAFKIEADHKNRFEGTVKLNDILRRAIVLQKSNKEDSMTLETLAKAIKKLDVDNAHFGKKWYRALTTTLTFCGRAKALEHLEWGTYIYRRLRETEDCWNGGGSYRVAKTIRAIQEEYQKTNPGKLIPKDYILLMRRVLPGRSWWNNNEYVERILGFLGVQGTKVADYKAAFSMKNIENITYDGVEDSAKLFRYTDKIGWPIVLKQSSTDEERKIIFEQFNAAIRHGHIDFFNALAIIFPDVAMLARPVVVEKIRAGALPRDYLENFEFSIFTSHFIQTSSSYDPDRPEKNEKRLGEILGNLINTLRSPELNSEQEIQKRTMVWFIDRLKQCIPFQEFWKNRKLVLEGLQNASKEHSELAWEQAINSSTVRLYSITNEKEFDEHAKTFSELQLCTLSIVSLSYNNFVVARRSAQLAPQMGGRVEDQAQYLEMLVLRIEKKLLGVRS